MNAEITTFQPDVRKVAPGLVSQSKALLLDFLQTNLFCLSASAMVFGAVNGFGPLDLLANKCIMLAGFVVALFAVFECLDQAKSTRKAVWFATLCGVLSGGYFCQNSATLPLFGILLFGGVGVVARAESRWPFQRFCRLSIAFLLFMALVNMSPVAYQVFDCYQSSMSAVAAAVGNVIFKADVHVRLWADVALYSLLVAVAFRSGTRFWQPVLACLGIVLLYGLLAVCFSKIAFYKGALYAAYCSALPIFVFSLVNGSLVQMNIKSAGPPESYDSRRVRAIVILLSALAAVWLVANFFSISELKAQPRSLAFYEGGYVDRIKPNEQKYGGINSGMFGMFPDYASLLGHRCKYINGDLTPDKLKGIDTLFITNPQTNWTQADLMAIWRYVNEGHGLIVLGDHTDVMGTQQSLNDLLRPVWISFNFDAGMFFKNEWKNCLWILPGDVTRHFYSPSSHQIAIGATLKCGGGSHPLVVGKYGFSDVGNRWNVQGAYLGDYIYAPDENIGNVPLVAEASFGKGRVLVFGDTSPFQNFELPWNCLDLFSDCINYCSGPLPKSVKLNGFAGSFLMIAAIILVLCRWNLLQNTFLTLVVIGVFAQEHRSRNLLENTNVSGKKVAVVDIGCNPRINSGHGSEKCIDGLFSSLVRNGYIPVCIPSPRASEMRNADLVIYVAPEKTIPAETWKAISKTGDKKGGVLLFASYAQRLAVMPVLGAYNLDIKNVPLGFATDNGLTKKDGPIFKDAYALGTLEEFKTNSPSIDYEILSNFRDTPVAVSADDGKVRLSVVADDGFALDENLEGIFTWNTNNIQFMNVILNKFK